MRERYESETGTEAEKQTTYEGSRVVRDAFRPCKEAAVTKELEDMKAAEEARLKAEEEERVRLEEEAAKKKGKKKK